MAGILYRPPLGEKWVNTLNLKTIQQNTHLFRSIYIYIYIKAEPQRGAAMLGKKPI